MSTSILLAMVLMSANQSYTVLDVGYRLESISWSIGQEHFRGVDHLVPKLGLTTFGGDWFLQLDAGWPAGASGRARFLSFGSVEVGAHLPTERGLLAVGLRAAGVRAGVRDRKDEAWTAGGVGLDGGIGVHFAMALVDRVRVDPAIALGASVLDGYSGVWASLGIDVLVKLSDQTSFVLGAAYDLRRYAPTTEDAERFRGHGARVDLGIAVHDVLGIGANRF